MDTGEGALSESSRARYLGWRTLVVALVLCVPGFVACTEVIRTAHGSHQVDVIDEGAATFLVWLSLPVAWVAARSRRIRWGGPPLLVGCAAAGLLSVAFTAWTVRLQAPDGSSYDIAFEEAIAELDHDVTAGLNAAVPGEWERREHDDSGSPCLDQFGRERGAVYGGRWYSVNALLSDEQFERFVAEIEGPGRQVQAPAFDRPNEFRGQDHEFFVVRLEAFDDQGASTVEIVTPCLRR